MSALASHRVGHPSPLLFYLGAAASAYGQALMAAPKAASPEFPWSSALKGEAADLGPELDQFEITSEIAARLSDAIRGLEAWQAHPYRRDMPGPEVIWQRGCSQLLDYGTAPESAAPDGSAVLVLPSLINRAYILDLEPENSMLRWLAGQGLRPVLLDWRAPGAQEAGFDLGAFATNRLLPAIDHLRAATGKPVALLGYCMGGTLAAGLAARTSGKVSCLATIGAPWDFSSTAGIAGGFRAIARAQGAGRIEDMLDVIGQAFGGIPVSLFQMLFALVNPMQAVLKFRRFARMDQASPEARHFVALEDWLADGVAMPTSAARDLLVDWQVRNVTAEGQWEFLGGRVDPGSIDMPVLAFCGERDSIAPPSIARPLARAIPDARIVTPDTGHVGMVAGRAARRQVWEPLARFLLSHSS